MLKNFLIFFSGLFTGFFCFHPFKQYSQWKEQMEDVKAFTAKNCKHTLAESLLRESENDHHVVQEIKYENVKEYSSKIFSYYKCDGLFWIRQGNYGPGFMIKDTRSHPLLFAQRKRKRPSLLFSWLYIEFFGNF